MAVKKEDVIAYLEKANMMEISELISEIEEKFGVSAAAPVAVAAVSPGSDASSPEKTEFDVYINAAGQQKINVIKVVRAITDLGLKEAKEIVDSAPKVIKNLYSKEEIEEFLKLYKDLPTTVHNKKQNVIKKRWLQGYNKKLEKLFFERLKKEIGDFKMDNLQDENGKDIYGLIQESYAPIGLHVDAGFESKSQIYKQSLIPLSPVGSTVIFKNRFYEGSTNFTQDPDELKKKKLNYGQNKRSSEHLKLYGNKPFDKNIHEKYLKHENIDNLKGLEVELIYEWEIGSMLIFDRTHLHCSSSVIEGKKIGITTFTKK